MQKEDQELKNLESIPIPIEENEFQKLMKSENQKRYINLIFFELSLDIMTYFYITLSGCMTIINHFIFKYYLFKFNFTFLFVQQFISSIIFLLISKTTYFKKKVGEISFSDFKKLQENYILFVFIFITNTIIGFYGHQLLLNIPIFLNLRKLCTIMYYYYDIIFEKKKIESYISVSLILITFGNILASVNDFNINYYGYIVVIFFNCITFFYNKLIENFKKNTGVSNLKLLVYNIFLSCPFLFLCIIISREYETIIDYFDDRDNNNGIIFLILLGSFLSINMQFCLFISNEKMSSLFTSMMSQCQNIIVTLIGKFVFRGNKFIWNINDGIIISTVGATMISVKSFLANMTENEK